MALELEGKIALITGAAQGMGRAVAERMAAAGARLVLNDRNPKTLRATAGALEGEAAEVETVTGDVSSGGDVARLVERALERFGAIHVLVNNAGILRPTAVIDLEEEEWDRVMNVNLKGTYLCSRAVLPAMRREGWGRIVNFSSTAGRSVSTLGGAHYTAAKAGVLGFTRHLAKEEAPHGITVNAVCPGLIDTEMVRDTIDAERMRSYARSFPISRLGKPGEVAALVVFLASDQAAYITGASLDINGGDLMI